MIKAARNTTSKACALALALYLCTAPAHIPLAFAADGGQAAADGGSPATNTANESVANIPQAPQVPDPTNSGFVVAASSISAQIQTDAGIHVSVQNSLKVGRNCNAFMWSIVSLNGDSTTSVNSVRIAYLNADGKIEGDWISLSGTFFDAGQRDALVRLDSANASISRDGAAASSDNGEWMFDSSESILYAFFASEADRTEDEGAQPASSPDAADMVIDIDYTVSNAVMAYEDVGEMYWYYLSGGNNMPIWDVSAVIQLPVPHGMEIEPGETVVAWGHGSPGTVDVQADGTVRYAAPYVAAGQYLMAHVVFPVSWLENMSRETRQLHSGLRRASAIEGETDWTDTSAANTINSLAVDVVSAAICAIGLAAAIVLYLARSRENAPDESTLRTISDMNAGQLRQRLFAEASPAVIARLMRNGRISDSDFTTSIEHLIYTGAITTSNDLKPEPAVSKSVAERILQQRHAPNALDHIRLHIGKNAKDNPLQPIEHETLKVLFEGIADGYPTLPVSEIHSFAETKPVRFAELIEEWQEKLSNEVAAAEVFDPKGAKMRRGISMAAVVYLVLGIAFGIAFASPIIAACGIIAAIAMAAIACKCSGRTTKGTEIALMWERLQMLQERGPRTDGAPAEPEGFPEAAFTKMLEDDLANAYKHR